MSIRSLEISKDLRIHGKRLGRSGLAERVFALVDEFNKNRSYKNAIVLAGKLKAIAQACKFDCYWDEKCSMGFDSEIHDIQVVSMIGTLPAGEESWWIK
jgi:hypothetical protein